MYTIGLDIGTSGVKSTVFDVKANIMGYAYCEYNISSTRQKTYTLSAFDVLNACVAVLRESAQRCGNPEKIKAISISSIGESFVCLDKNDQPLYDVMLYMDKRGTDECEELTSGMSKQEIYSITGCYIDPMYAVYKLRWLAKNHPEVLDNTARICFVADYIAFRLGADHVCDYSLAGRSGLLCLKDKSWWGYGTDFVGISKDKLPAPIPGGAVAGKVSAKMSAQLGGICAGTKIILGGHDQIMTVIGSGANRPGDVVNGMGTVDCLTSLVGADIDKEQLLENNMPLVPFLDQDAYATYAFNMSGGINNKWFCREMAKDLLGSANRYGELNKEATDVPSELIYFPYLCGGGTPQMDADTPAAMIGLRLNTTRGEMFRAVLEGTTYEMRYNLEQLEKCGSAINRIMAVGGGSVSELWMQIRADIYERKVEVPAIAEAGTIANAILCYKALGVFGTVEEAQNALIAKGKTYLPKEQNKSIYRNNYKRYLHLYTLLKELYH